MSAFGGKADISRHAVVAARQATPRAKLDAVRVDLRIATFP